MTAKVCHLAEAMKTFVTKNLHSLDANLASESVGEGAQDKSLSRLWHGAEKGIELITDVQEKVADLNRDMRLLHDKAASLGRGYSGMMERLENNFDLWATASGMKRFDDFRSMQESLQRDLTQLQDRIAHTDIVIGKLQSPHIGTSSNSLGGLTQFFDTVPRAIKTSLLQRERMALVIKNGKLEHSAKLLGYGVKITRFVESVFSQIDAMRARVKSVQAKTSSINEEFDIILRQWAEIQSIVKEESTSSAAVPSHDRLRMDRICRLLENISTTAHLYREPTRISSLS